MEGKERREKGMGDEQGISRWNKMTIGCQEVDRKRDKLGRIANVNVPESAYLILAKEHYL